MVLTLFTLIKITFIHVFVGFLRNHTYVTLQDSEVPWVLLLYSEFEAPYLVEELITSPRCHI